MILSEGQFAEIKKVLKEVSIRIDTGPSVVLPYSAFDLMDSLEAARGVLKNIKDIVENTPIDEDEFGEDDADDIEMLIERTCQITRDSILKAIDRAALGEEGK